MGATTMAAQVLRVSSRSNPNKLAGAIAGIIRDKGTVELLTIGAGALNQAVKALIIARGFVTPNGVDLIYRPSFANLMIGDYERTAIRLAIEPNQR